jgi:hypothetical protein
MLSKFFIFSIENTCEKNSNKMSSHDDLTEAIMENDIDTVEYLIYQKVIPRPQDFEDAFKYADDTILKALAGQAPQTFLFAAIDAPLNKNTLRYVDMAIKSGADPNSMLKETKTLPVVYALSQRQYSAAKYLMYKTTVPIDLKTLHRGGVLFYAIYNAIAKTNAPRLRFDITKVKNEIQKMCAEVGTYEVFNLGELRAFAATLGIKTSSNSRRELCALIAEKIESWTFQCTNKTNIFGDDINKFNIRTGTGKKFPHSTFGEDQIVQVKDKGGRTWCFTLDESKLEENIYNNEDLNIRVSDKRLDQFKNIYKNYTNYLTREDFIKTLIPSHRAYAESNPRVTQLMNLYQSGSAIGEQIDKAVWLEFLKLINNAPKIQKGYMTFYGFVKRDVADLFLNKVGQTVKYRRILSTNCTKCYERFKRYSSGDCCLLRLLVNRNFLFIGRGEGVWEHTVIAPSIFKVFSIGPKTMGKLQMTTITLIQVGEYPRSELELELE